jgi:hypothetical protein
MPCSFCVDNIEGSFYTHRRIECPYRRSIYCYICSMYGHRIKECPNHRAKAIRQGLPADTIKNLEFKVVDSEDTICAILSSYNIQPANKVENRKLLVDLANSMNPPRMLILVPPKLKVKSK